MFELNQSAFDYAFDSAVVGDLVHHKLRSIQRKINTNNYQCLQEYMKLLGLSNLINWFAWLFKYAILMLISVSFMTILFHVKPGGAAVISYTHPSITFVFLFLYTLSIISFCFAITTFFNKGNLMTRRNILTNLCQCL